MSARAEDTPKPLIVAVLVMTLVVLTLGGGGPRRTAQTRLDAATTAERVLSNWEQAIEQDPESDTAHTGLALALLQLGRSPTRASPSRPR